MSLKGQKLSETKNLKHVSHQLLALKFRSWYITKCSYKILRRTKKYHENLQASNTKLLPILTLADINDLLELTTSKMLVLQNLKYQKTHGIVTDLLNNADKFISGLEQLFVQCPQKNMPQNFSLSILMLLYKKKEIIKTSVIITLSLSIKYIYRLSKVLKQTNKPHS